MKKLFIKTILFLALVSPFMAQAQPAPRCVGLSQWEQGPWYNKKSYARATNNCSYTVRVRMIWAWAGDGACTTLPRGWQLTEWRWGRLPYVSELRAC